MIKKIPIKVVVAKRRGTPAQQKKFKRLVDQISREITHGGSPVSNRRSRADSIITEEMKQNFIAGAYAPKAAIAPARMMIIQWL